MKKPPHPVSAGRGRDTEGVNFDARTVYLSHLRNDLQSTAVARRTVLLSRM